MIEANLDILATAILLREGSVQAKKCAEFPGYATVEDHKSALLWSFATILIEVSQHKSQRTHASLIYYIISQKCPKNKK